MKNFKKLIKISYDFYIPMLIIVLSVMITIGHYDLQIKNTQNIINHEAAGYNLCRTLMGIVTQSSYFNFYMLLVMALMIVILKKLSFYGGRKIEFIDSLPLKKNTIVMFDYIMMLGIGIITILAYGIILACRQTSINIKIMNKTDSFDLNVLFSINGRLFLLLLEICIFYAIYFTLCYIGIYMAKNALAGAIFTGLTFAVIYELYSMMPGMEKCMYWFIPSLYFQEYKPYAILPSFCLLVLLIILLVYVAGSRDNSTSILFVTKAAVWWLICVIALIYFIIITMKEPLFILLAFAVPLCIIVFMHIKHTKHIESTNNWEVK